MGETTQIPTREDLNAYVERFKKVIVEKFIPIIYTLAGPYGDLLKTGVGHKNLVSWGVFPMDSKGNTLMKPGVYTEEKNYEVDPTQIKEYVKYSWFEDDTTGLNPTGPEPAGTRQSWRILIYQGTPIQ